MHCRQQEQNSRLSAGQQPPRQKLFLRPISEPTARQTFRTNRRNNCASKESPRVCEKHRSPIVYMPYDSPNSLVHRTCRLLHIPVPMMSLFVNDTWARFSIYHSSADWANDLLSFDRLRSSTRNCRFSFTRGSTEEGNGTPQIITARP